VLIRFWVGLAGNIPYSSGNCAGLQLRMSGTMHVSVISRGHIVGSVIKKRRKRMAKKKHRKLLKRTRIQRRRAGK
jgi:hypothetical protein